MIRATGIPLRGVKIVNDEPYYDGLDNRILLHFRYKGRVYRITDADYMPMGADSPRYGFCDNHGYRWEEPHDDCQKEALALAIAIIRLTNIQ